MIQPVPLLDLYEQQQKVDETIRVGFEEVIEASAFIAGVQVAEFEQRWSDYCGARFAAGVANGTDAVELALRAVGVGRGDEVLVPVNTFAATAEAVARTGASSVFVDCDP